MQLETYIARARARTAELEQAMAGFDFRAGNQRAYEDLTREYQSRKQLLAAWDRCRRTAAELEENQGLLETESDPEFSEVVRQEIETLETQLQTLDREIKTLILPLHPNAGRNLIVEIRPAAGGEEAGLFAADLYRMYTRFAEQQNWKAELLDLAETDLGGIKSAAFSVQNPDAYRYISRESGVHRVQRIPVTESGGRIHTSTVTVAVLPEAEDVDVQIKSDELRIDVFRSQGPGGQSVNTTDSAVRITHIPTGLVVTSQQEKSQHRNKDIAMRILRSRLLKACQAEENAKNAEQRRTQVGTGDRSERIRTYNFPQNRVTDHRYGITSYNLTEIMEGDLEGLLSEVAAAAAEQRLAEELESD